LFIQATRCLHLIAITGRAEGFRRELATPHPGQPGAYRPEPPGHLACQEPRVLTDCAQTSWTPPGGTDDNDPRLCFARMYAECQMCAE
jgi:hypothetical protein